MAAAASAPGNLVVALGVAAAPDYFALDCNPAAASVASDAVVLVVAAVLPAVHTQIPI